MEDKREQLLTNAKYAVQKYGMDGITVKNLSEECGVNDSHLHRFYKNKEEFLLEAYKRESGEIFRTLLQNLDETKNVPLDFKTRVRLHFHRTWTDFLSDPARLAFCVYYYHSACFAAAEDFHQEQVEILYDRLKHLFPDKQTCVMTVYTLLTFMYDSAKRVADSKEENSPEIEERMFNQYYSLLSCQMSNAGA